MKTKTYIAWLDADALEDNTLHFEGVTQADSAKMFQQLVKYEEWHLHVQSYVIQTLEGFPDSVAQEVQKNLANPNNQMQGWMQVHLTKEPNAYPVSVFKGDDDSVVEDWFLDSIEDIIRFSSADPTEFADDELADPELLKYKIDFIDKQQVGETKGIKLSDLGKSFTHSTMELTLVGWNIENESTPIVVMDKSDKEKYFMSVSFVKHKLGIE